MPDFPLGEFGEFWFIREMKMRAGKARRAAQRDERHDRKKGILAKCPHCDRCVQTYADEQLLICLDGHYHSLYTKPSSPGRIVESVKCK